MLAVILQKTSRRVRVFCLEDWHFGVFASYVVKLSWDGRVGPSSLVRYEI